MHRRAQMLGSVGVPPLLLLLAPHGTDGPQCFRPCSWLLAIRTKSKLGQNFLIDLNLVEVIVNGAELLKDDLIVEVGSGTGGLTARLVDHAGAVLSVEIDPAFYQLTQETIRESESVVLINADVLETKNKLNPEVLDSLARLRETSGLKRLKLVANLPYAVATPV